MNPNDILKVRAERIKVFKAAAGGGKSGVVPAGMAAYLLAVSASRIKTLVQAGRLETISQAGQRWILFSSICEYERVGQQFHKASQAVMPKSGTSKAVVTR